ncbi:hypothetical protein Taro_040261 [Colocasia esculenta]|uniref:Protein kinase domain-containing protein n=1 Tax=Colocasia esculenta TaxID=4460 RepID=A0A843WSH9_COLES|nr:hypothetical protein [Colocasia esculenta]
MIAPSSSLLRREEELSVTLLLTSSARTGNAMTSNDRPSKHPLVLLFVAGAFLRSFHPSFQATTQRDLLDNFVLHGVPWKAATTEDMRLKTIFRKKSDSPTPNFFTRNGELLLQKQISFSQGRSNPIRTFTLGELQDATHNFDQTCRLDFLSFKYYIGILDDSQVVVKNANVDENSAGDDDDSLVEEHITEIVVLTNVRHRNIVRLLGCCLEARVPLLVYEFIPNGDLGYNLDRWRTAGPPPWTTRLQIAIDVANAVSYLHCHNISRPIVHKNLKIETIILDEDNTAKLTGFGYSVSMPPDTTQVQEDGYRGSVSYLDPEYVTTGTVTEKVDVYAFGVLLLELMTGTSLFSSSYEPLFNMRASLEGLRDPLLPHVEPVRTFLPEGEDSAKLYQLAVEEVCLEKLVADASTALQGSAGGNAEQVRALAQLALKCAGPKMQERPAMKEVAKELKRIGSMAPGTRNEPSCSQPTPTQLKFSSARIDWLFELTNKLLPNPVRWRVPSGFLGGGDVAAVSDHQRDDRRDGNCYLSARSATMSSSNRAPQRDGKAPVSPVPPSPPAPPLRQSSFSPVYWDGVCYVDDHFACDQMEVAM